MWKKHGTPTRRQYTESHQKYSGKLTTTLFPPPNGPASSFIAPLAVRQKIHRRSANTFTAVWQKHPSPFGKHFHRRSAKHSSPFGKHIHHHSANTFTAVWQKHSSRFVKHIQRRAANTLSAVRRTQQPIFGTFRPVCSKDYSDSAIQLFHLGRPLTSH